MNNVTDMSNQQFNIMVIQLIQYRNSRAEGIKRAAIRQRTALQTSVKYFTFAKYPSGIFKKKCNVLIHRYDIYTRTRMSVMHAHADRRRLISQVIEILAYRHFYRKRSTATVSDWRVNPKRPLSKVGERNATRKHKERPA